MPKINPEILSWARETAGLSVEEACRKLNFADTKEMSAIDRLRAYETGKKEPSRSLLLQMTKQYHRSLLVFYMANPPMKGNRGIDFRTLPKEYSPESDAVIDALLRNIQTRQSIIRAALEDEDDIKELHFVNSMKIDFGIDTIINSITKTINFDLLKFRKKSSPENAFSYLRSCSESVGIYVILISDLGSHHTKINVEDFRGFAIADNLAPFVVINDQDSKAAWSFTLIHELVHIWLGQTGISNINIDKKIERFCNDVASELLLPKVDLLLPNIKAMNFDEQKEYISNFATNRNLSSTMIAYRLYRDEIIDKEIWMKLNTYYYELWIQNKRNKRKEAKGKKGGPSYYVVHRYLLGPNIIGTVQRMMIGGIITTTKAGRVLGVKPKNVQRLLDPST